MFTRELSNNLSNFCFLNSLLKTKTRGILEGEPALVMNSDGEESQEED